MKKLFVFALMGVAIFATLSCKGSAKADVTVAVRVPYATRFPAALVKYDDVLKEAHDINQSLLMAEMTIDNFTANMQYLVGEYRDLQESGMKEALAAYKDYLTSQGVVIGVRVTVGVGVTASSDEATASASGTIEVYLISPDVISPELEQNIQAFRQMVGDVPVIVDSLTEAVDSSVEVLTRVNEISQTVDTDFTGPNVIHAPKAVSALAEAATVLAETPARAVALKDELMELKDALLEVFGVPTDEGM